MENMHESFNVHVLQTGIEMKSEAKKKKKKKDDKLRNDDKTKGYALNRFQQM